MRRNIPILTPGTLSSITPFGLYSTEIYSRIRCTPKIIMFPSAYHYVALRDSNLPECLSSLIEKYHPAPSINKEMLIYYSPAYKLMRSIFHKRTTPLIRLKYIHKVHAR